MSPGIGVGVGLPFVHLQRRSSSILDQLFGGGQGMYAVAGLRGKNLMPESNDFADAAWSKSSTSVTATDVSHPTAVGSTVTLSGSFGWIFETSNVVSGRTYSVAFDLKAGTLTKASIRSDHGTGGADVYVAFDLALGTAGSGGRIESLGDGWYRCHVEGIVANSASGLAGVYPGTPGSDTSGTVHVARGMWNEGETSAAYEATTGTALAGSWLDQTGGGRHLMPPGGSADPIQLDHDGTDYFYFPGTSGNYLSTPDAVALSVTGDLEIVVHMTMPTSTTNNLVTKYQTTGNNRSYRLNISSGGFMQLAWSTNGEGGGFVAATATSAIANNSAGAEVWVKATIDVDNGASGYDVKFWESLDGVSWSQVGSTVTGGGATSIYDGSAAVYIGWAADGLTNYMAGVVYRAIIKDGIDGTTVLDVNASDADEDSSTFTEASSNAATVTINRSASGYKTAVVTQPVALFATDDYLTIADTDNFFDVGALDSVTWFTVLRAHDNNASQGLLSKSSAFNTQGWKSSLDGASAMQSRIRDGSSNDTNVSVSFTEGVLVAAGGRVDRATGTQHAFVGATFSVDDDASAVGDMSNSEPVRLGLLSTSYAAMEVVAVAFTKQALTAQQISDAKDALLALNSGG